jgi:anti-sigma factor RsiW
MARGFERLMKEQATRDELLSAYLDDQLDAEERARLEAQLKTDPALRSELEMLRRTVTLVRDLPQQPIPRNFILPRTAAPKARPAPATRRPRWLAPFLTAATAAVSFLFVAVLAGDLLFSGVGGMAQFAAPAPAADEAVVESAPVEKAVEEEKEAPQMLAVTESPERGAEPGALPETGEGEGLATPPPAVAASPTVPDDAEKVDSEEENAEPTPAPEGAPMPAVGGGGESTVESPAPTPTPSASGAADVVAPSDTPEEEKIVPVSPPEPATVEPTAQVLRDTEPAPGEVAETEPPPGDGERSEHDRGDQGILFHVTPWRTAEIALGAFALLLVLATIWAWRARRR